MGRGSARAALSILAGMAVAAFAYYGVWGEGGRIFLDGPLSAKHKELEADCHLCHTPWAGVSSAACSKCHKAKGHAIPRPGTGPKTLAAMEANRPECGACHNEHRGEFHNVRLAGDGRCAECHQGNPHSATKPGGKIREATQSGVLMTHNAFYAKGEYGQAVCMGCHSGEKGKPIVHSSKYLVDTMYKHMVELGVKCFDCHAPVVMEGFDAKGGELAQAKCVACHKERKVANRCQACHKYHKEPQPAQESAKGQEAPSSGPAVSAAPGA